MKEKEKEYKRIILIQSLRWQAKCFKMGYHEKQQVLAIAQGILEISHRYGVIDTTEELELFIGFCEDIGDIKA